MTLFRISLLVFLLPFFGGENAPVPFKAALCLVLSLGLWSRLSFAADAFPAHPFMIALMILGELLLGLILGLIVRILFAAIQTGAQLVGFQMGFAMANVIDPNTGANQTVMAHFLSVTSLLIFLSLNGHLYLLHLEAKRYDKIFIDLPGLSRSENLENWLARKEFGPPDEACVHLVLNAHYATHCLERFAKRFRVPHLASIIWYTMKKA